MRVAVRELGADVIKIERDCTSEESVARYNATTKRVYDKLKAFLKPTIAQITGFCIGGGVALSLSRDMRICGKGAQFAVPAAKLGLGCGFPGIKRLVNVVDPSFAKDILFTARRFDAEELRVTGLVNRVVEDEDVAQVAEDTAKMIAANAPMTAASVKFIVGETLKDESKRDEEVCARRVKAYFESQD